MMLDRTHNRCYLFASEPPPLTSNVESVRRAPRGGNQIKDKCLIVHVSRMFIWYFYMSSFSVIPELCMFFICIKHILAAVGYPLFNIYG